MWHIIGKTVMGIDLKCSDQSPRALVELRMKYEERLENAVTQVDVDLCRGYIDAIQAQLDKQKTKG
jgi:hypothetical protein